MLSIIERKNIEKLIVLPKLYESTIIADGIASNDEKFSISFGLNEKQVGQLKKYSLDLSDSDLHDNTTDYERFGTGDFAERFEKKERYYFVLTHNDSRALASIFWFGPRSLPDTSNLSDAITSVSSNIWDTISLRTYGDFRGAGVTSAFSKFVLAQHKEIFPRRRIWLGVKKDNVAGIHLYEKLGFETVGDDEAENEFIMVLKRNT